MQAFVPAFEYDLYVSSSRVDDAVGELASGDFASWVDDMTVDLRSMLARKLGARDWGIVISRPAGADEHADERAGRAAVLLVVLNRAYLTDKACLSELGAFLAGHPVGDVLVVLAEEVPRENWPASLQDRLEFEFLVDSPTGEEGASAHRRRLDASDKLYPVRLDDLSAEAARTLERLKAEAEGRQPEKLPAVFLGAASPDVSDLRDGLRRYLVQEGFRILPSRWYPRTEAAFRRGVAQDVPEAHMLVQLLGALPLPALDDSSIRDGTIEVEAAMRANIPIMNWRHPQLDPHAIADAEHRSLIDNEFVLAVSIEEFKRKVAERAHAHTSSLASRSDKPLVVVAAADVDRSLAQRVGELLDGKGLSIEIPDTEEFPWDRYSNGQSGVGGLVIVYGACPAIWVRQQLWKYRKAMARTEFRPPLCAVCEAPPEIKEPLRYEVPQMDTIDCRLQITESALSSFIDAVQLRCSQ